MRTGHATALATRQRDGRRATTGGGAQVMLMELEGLLRADCRAAVLGRGYLSGGGTWVMRGGGEFELRLNSSPPLVQFLLVHLASRDWLAGPKCPNK